MTTVYPQVLLQMIDPFYSTYSAAKEKMPPEQILELLRNKSDGIAKSPYLCYRLVKKLAPEEAMTIFPDLIHYLSSQQNAKSLEPFVYRGLSKNRSTITAFVAASIENSPKRGLIELYKAGIQYDIPELLEAVDKQNDPDFKEFLIKNKAALLAYFVSRTSANIFAYGHAFSQDPYAGTLALGLLETFYKTAKTIFQKL